MSARWLELDGAVNARVLADGVLLRADNLQDLTPEDIRILVEDERVEAIVDLRTGVELAMEGPGPLTEDDRVRIEHRSLYPERGNTDLDEDWIRPWGDDALDDYQTEPGVVRAYLGYLDRRPDSVVEALRTIAHAQGAVLVHCAAGKDRTGTVCAVAMAAVGVPREEIVADYLATAERIEAIMARLLGSETYRAELEGHDVHSHAPRPGMMERVLDVLEDRHGGAVAWLASHGFGEDDLTALRARLAPVAR